MAPGGLLRQRDAVERAAASELHFDGDGITDGDIRGADVDSQGKIAHRAVEPWRNIVPGQREGLDDNRLVGQRDVLNPRGAAKEKIKRPEQQIHDALHRP